MLYISRENQGKFFVKVNVSFIRDKERIISKNTKNAELNLDDMDIYRHFHLQSSKELFKYL